MSGETSNGITIYPENGLVGGSDLSIPEQTIDQLQTETNPETRQATLDGIFTDKRRDTMLKTASRDRHGRPVRYFRFMPFEKLVLMAKEGKQTPLQYFKDPTERVDEKEFSYYLKNYASHLEWNDDAYDALRNKPLADIAQSIFGTTVHPAELAQLLQNPTHELVQQFVARNVDLEYVKERHSSSGGLKYSPFLSISVGGPIMDKLYPGQIYLEMVIPDNQIELRAKTMRNESTEGEKEVFVKEIPISAVTRAYSSTNSLWNREITNPTTPVGKYYQNGSLDPVEAWRWKEKTEDYLPVSLLHR